MTARTARILLAFAAACLLSVTMVAASEGDYNLHPTYCESHTAWDPLWWIYKCWLPNPPGVPM